MSQVQPIDEAGLIQQGLASYWDARFALRTFEDTIRDAAEQVLKANLPGLGEACTMEKPPEEKDVWPHDPEKDCRLGQVAIGAGYGWEWGIRLGVGWRSFDDIKKIQPVACLALRVSAQWKKDIILRFLKKCSLDAPNHQTFITESREGPHEVAVWSPLPSDAGLDKIRASLSTTFDTTVEWCKAAGGLQRVLYPDTQPPTSAS
jgi:hypothetical protein